MINLWYTSSGLLTAINCYNVKWVTRVTDIFTGTKCIALMVIVGAGIYYLADGHTEHWQQPFSGGQWEAGYIALAFYSGLFSYSGWNYLNFVTEELKDPYRNLPRAICISMPVVTIIYMITNVAYFSVLSTDEIISSSAVAVTFGDKMLGYLAWIMPMAVACSTFGSLNGAIFASSRLFFVGARNGHLPAAISLININCLTPVPSLIFLVSNCRTFLSHTLLTHSRCLQCVITLSYLYIDNIYVLINYVSYVEALFTLISVAGLLWLRYKQPKTERPIRVSLILPIIYLIVCLFLVIASCWESPKEVGVGTIIILTGIPIYYLTIHKPVEWLENTSQAINMWCSKFFICMPNQEKFD